MNIVNHGSIFVEEHHGGHDVCTMIFSDLSQGMCSVVNLSRVSVK